MIELIADRLAVLIPAVLIFFGVAAVVMIVSNFIFGEEDRSDRDMWDQW